MNNLLEKLWDETARIDRIILLAGAISQGDSFPDDLNDFFDEEDRKSIETALGPIPEWLDIEQSGLNRDDGVCEWLRDSGKLGFLIKFSTPVMTASGPNSRSYSWGYYNTTWIYGDTLDEAIDKGLKWVESRRMHEDKKAKSKKGGAA